MASDKISHVNNLRAKQRLRKVILNMYDDGYTIQEIAALHGLRGVEVAGIISQAIKDEAERCA